MIKFKLFLFLMVSMPLFSQYKPDTVITNEAYSAYVNKELGEPLYVKYKLYKGGGKCQRATNWVNDTKLKLVNEEQYKGTLYDSLMVYCGGYWGSPNLVVNGMKIPSICWKVVYSLSLKKVVFCSIYYNTDTPVKTDTNLGKLEMMLGYSLDVFENPKKKKKKQYEQAIQKFRRK